MNNKSVFERAMCYIDENITKSTDEIKQGLSEIVGISPNKFCSYFQILTNQTIGDYIRDRRLYWAAWELKFVKEKPIVDIALSYGYGEQSSFTRAISTHYSVTPMEIRNGDFFPENNKAVYPGTKDSTMDKIIDRIESANLIGGYGAKLISKYSDAQKNYPFSVEAVSMIFDLAELLDIPVELLLDACFDVYTEVHSNPGKYILDSDYTIIAAQSYGITSEEELRDICIYYDCSPYELDELCVENYHNRKLNTSPISDMEDNYVDPT